MMNCEISAVVVSNGRDVWVLEIPGTDIPPGCREIGTMQFLDGKCLAKSSDATMETTIMMAAATSAFAELVCVRLRERNDYREWRRKLLAMPSPILAN